MTLLDVDDDGSPNPFPPAIRSDDWIAYHGTSAAYAEKIEAEGLGHGGIPEWFEDARRLFELSKELYYFGRPGGFSTLPFAVSEGEVSSGAKLVHLAEDFERACVFAFATGGESINAIRIALDDLLTFVSSPERQQEHHDQLVLRSATVGGDPSIMRAPGPREAAARDWHPTSEVFKIHRALSLLESPGELQRQVARFARLGSLVDEIQQKHAPLVYAVRLSPAESIDGSYSSSRGIALRVVPPDRLVAKCHLKFTRDSNPPLDDDGLETISRWLQRFDSPPLAHS